MRKPLTILFSAALALAMLPAAAFAAPGAQPDADAPLAAQAGENIASGTWGTCPWEISADGVLTVHPGEGAFTDFESPWKDYREFITKIVFIEESGAKVIGDMRGCPMLFNLKLDDETSKIEEIDLRGFDTSEVQDMRYMFLGCSALTSLDLSTFDTSQVHYMNAMFSGCSSLATLDLSSFNTAHLDDMTGMFYGCAALTSIDLSSFDTSNVSSMEQTFFGCAALRSLDLSHFNTSKVRNMSKFCHGCTSLVSADISGLDTTNLVVPSTLFEKCPALESVTVGSNTLVGTGVNMPYEVVKGHLNWYSKAAAKWCTNLQIKEDRKSIADTYVKGDETYKQASISNQNYELGSGVGITIRFDGPFDRFFELDINGETIDPSRYAVRSGSTIIELPEATLSKLGEGEHKVVALYDDGGIAASSFIVKEASSDGPGTDPDNPGTKPEPSDPGTTDPKPDDPGTTDPGATDPKPDEPGTADPEPDDGDEPGTTDSVSTQAMYRLYNPNSGEHFYTASTIERDSVIAAGWNDEGIGWTAPTSGIQVYRLYNSYAGEHHYTTSAEERDMLVSVGWTWEEGGWFSDVNESVPLYRAYNPNAFANNHHYTTDWGEFVTLLGLGWRDEGIGWHGVK